MNELQVVQAAVPSPADFAVATLVGLVFGFALISLAGLAILQVGRGFIAEWAEPRIGKHLAAFFMLLFTAALLILCSDRLASTWGSVFRVTDVGLPWSWAAGAAYVLVATACTIIIAATGGSPASPFSPLLFLILPLATLLQESRTNLAIYFVVASCLFIYTVLRDSSSFEKFGGGRRTLAYIWVTVSSFLVATIVGVLAGST